MKSDSEFTFWELQKISNSPNFRTLNYAIGVKRLMLKKNPKMINLLGIDQSKSLINNLKFGENEKLAEFIGIMLGDCHLNNKIYRVQISLNGIDSPNYLI